MEKRNRPLRRRRRRRFQKATNAPCRLSRGFGTALAWRPEDLLGSNLLGIKTCELSSVQPPSPDTGRAPPAENRRRPGGAYFVTCAAMVETDAAQVNSERSERDDQISNRSGSYNGSLFRDMSIMGGRGGPVDRNVDRCRRKARRAVDDQRLWRTDRRGPRCRGRASGAASSPRAASPRRASSLRSAGADGFLRSPRSVEMTGGPGTDSRRPHFAMR